MIKVTQRKVDQVVVVDLGGRIVLGDGSATLRDAIHDLLAAHETRILLNLAEVSYIDSSGLGELIAGFTAVRARGGELKLLHLTRKVHDLLQITKLYTVFDIKDDEATAIASFSPLP